jgi:ATP-dependent Clp protease adapter protein ClpS
LISEIEEDGVFYCIYDYRTMVSMGQKTRHKFKVLNHSDSINISDYQIELLEEKMIMIL